MTVEEFDYDLPEELIAQTPLKKRDESRLMVLDKKTGEIEHRHFRDIISYLEPGDTLVLMILKFFLLDFMVKRKIRKLLLKYCY